jgi:hypothetical protein
MSPRGTWDEAARDHHSAIQAYLETARAIPETSWALAPREGKWSPQEITRHLILTYEALALQQETGAAIPVAFSPFKAWVLRTFMLPRLLNGRPFPPGVKSPRQVRPRGPFPPREELLASFEAAADRFRVAFEAASGRPGATATHPYFGDLTLIQMHRFASLHTAHHRRQLEWAIRSAP